MNKGAIAEAASDLKNSDAWAYLMGVGKDYGLSGADRSDLAKELWALMKEIRRQRRAQKAPSPPTVA